jgi:aromatic ring-cleaving dioxygenase
MRHRALATAVPPADPGIIRHYHAHVYYDPVSSRGRAARLRERGGRGIPGCDPGPLVRRARRAASAIDVSDRVPARVSWLMLNRDGLTILLHPGTGNAYADHTDHAVWFGSMLPLRLDVLRATRRRRRRMPDRQRLGWGPLCSLNSP